jgi:hypothetical protein
MRPRVRANVFMRCSAEWSATPTLPALLLAGRRLTAAQNHVELSPSNFHPILRLLPRNDFPTIADPI